MNIIELIAIILCMGSPFLFSFLMELGDIYLEKLRRKK